MGMEDTNAWHAVTRLFEETSYSPCAYMESMSWTMWADLRVTIVLQVLVLDLCLDAPLIHTRDTHTRRTRATRLNVSMDGQPTLPHITDLRGKVWNI